MIDLALTFVDYLIYLLQAVAFVTIARKLLNSRFYSEIDTVAYIGGILCLFSTIVLFNKFEYTVGYVEIIGYLVVMWSYCLLFFDNNFYLKLFVPILSYLLYTGVLFVYYLFAGAVLDIDWYNLLKDDTFYSYVAKVIINLTFVFLLYILYKFCNYRIKFASISEYVFFIILPIIAIGILFLSFVISTDRKTSQQAMFAMAVISAAVVFICTMVMSLMVRAARGYQIQTQNLLLQKEQEMYRERIAEANDSLKEIAVIRHDMKNKMLCIGELLDSENYDEAKNLCSDINSELQNATVLFHTKNVYLNSILNITYKKARDKLIDIKIIVACDCEGIQSTDLVAMLGNGCDNAIEYLSTIEKPRNMEVKLTKKGSYYFVSVKNNIVESVLKNNPKLYTTKGDKFFHGRGIGSIKAIAKKYNGNVDILEKNDDFILNIMLEIPPEFR